MGGNSFTMSPTDSSNSGSGCHPCIWNGIDRASVSNDVNECASANNEGND